ncbi:hypothetical protein RSAG8_12417, partial [Rhizoctonia solani AG-8 WAC10335]
MRTRQTAHSHGSYYFLLKDLSCLFSGITYYNTVTGPTKYGIIIDQSYSSSTVGTPETGVKPFDVAFPGTNTVSIASGAKELGVNWRLWWRVVTTNAS